MSDSLCGKAVYCLRYLRKLLWPTSSKIPFLELKHQRQYPPIPHVRDFAGFRGYEERRTHSAEIEQNTRGIHEIGVLLSGRLHEPTTQRSSNANGTLVWLGITDPAQAGGIPLEIMECTPACHGVSSSFADKSSIFVFVSDLWCTESLFHNADLKSGSKKKTGVGCCLQGKCILDHERLFILSASHASRTRHFKRNQNKLAV